MPQRYARRKLVLWEDGAGHPLSWSIEWFSGIDVMLSAIQGSCAPFESSTEVLAELLDTECTQGALFD